MTPFPKHMRCPAGEVKGLKAQCNSLADAAQSEKFELLAAKQENERLQDQIVQVGHPMWMLGTCAALGRWWWWLTVPSCRVCKRSLLAQPDTRQHPLKCILVGHMPCSDVTAVLAFNRAVQPSCTAPAHVSTRGFCNSGSAA